MTSRRALVIEMTDEMVKRAALAWTHGKDDGEVSKGAARFAKPVRRMLEAALRSSDLGK